MRRRKFQAIYGKLGGPVAYPLFVDAMNKTADVVALASSALWPSARARRATVKIGCQPTGSFRPWNCAGGPSLSV
jgi:hypothetical protein